MVAADTEQGSRDRSLASPAHRPGAAASRLEEQHGDVAAPSWMEQSVEWAACCCRSATGTIRRAHGRGPCVPRKVVCARGVRSPARAASDAARARSLPALEQPPCGYEILSTAEVETGYLTEAAHAVADAVAVQMKRCSRRVEVAVKVQQRADCFLEFQSCRPTRVQLVEVALTEALSEHFGLRDERERAQRREVDDARDPEGARGSESLGRFREGGVRLLQHRWRSDGNGHTLIFGRDLGHNRDNSAAENDQQRVAMLGGARSADVGLEHRRWRGALTLGLDREVRLVDVETESV